MSLPTHADKHRRARLAVRRQSLAVLIIGVTGCLDYNPFRKDEPDTKTHHDTDLCCDSDHWPALIEICDGQDNDGDGATDEGFEDLDANGVKDCLECDALQAAEAMLEVREDCGPDIEVDDPWNVVVEWEVAGLGSLQAPPVVGDLDRDGLPELVVQNGESQGGAKLYLLNGEDGTVEWSRPFEAHSGAGLALADITGDSQLEIVAHQGDFDAYPLLLSRAGVPIWTSDTSCGLWLFCAPLLADLGVDGGVEIISGNVVFEGSTGIPLAQIYDPQQDWTLPAIGDIDLDGTQEIVLQGCVYGSDYQLRWCIEDRVPTMGSFAALVQADSDPEAELLFMNRQIGLYDTDGSVIFEVTLEGEVDNNVSPPTIADFDGDGQIEIAYSIGSRLQMIELDGRSNWSRQLVDDTRGRFGIVGFDFDGDGANELVVTDTENMYIFDGLTGETRFVEARHSSATVLDHPLVVDIDADGAAEIVLASWNPDEDDVSLRVFGHIDNAWPSTGTHWPSYDFQVTNIREDGSLCTEQPYPWQEWNMYRARPAGEGPRPNHTLVLNDACGGTCKDAGFIEVSFQVGNDGIRGALAGAVVSLYRIEGGQRVLLDQTTTTSELAPGTLRSSQTLRASVSDVRGATLQLEVVGAPSRPECDTADDTLTFASPC